MSVRHHPSDELLLDYATGALGEAWSLAVATHLAFCPSCRMAHARLDSVGGALLADTAPETVSSDVLDRVMALLDDDEFELPESRSRPIVGSDVPILPDPLRRYLGGDLATVSWRRLGMGASQYVIPLGDHGATARLLRIPAGKPVPEHTHNGLELTLVLCGAFADATGTYGPGDLQEADETLLHQPHAAKGEDCICLAVTDAPLRFKSMAARLVQPLLGI
jgi:putative transcriptional regulator